MKNICLTITVLTGLIATGCSEKAAEEKEKTVSVKIMEAGESAASGRNYIGTVEEIYGSELSFEVGGNVEAVYVSEGDRVSKGRKLATVNSSSLKDLHEAEAATLKQAEDAYRRYEQLYKQGSLPDIKWVEVQSKLQQAVSAESVARKKLKDCELYSPMSGYVAKRNVDPGVNVIPGETVLKVVDISKVYIKFSVPENEIARISKGRDAIVTVSALDGETFEAKIAEKGVSANPVSHTYDVKIVMNNVGDRLLPGMVCNVYLPAESRQAIVIPVEAVQLDADGSRFVWVAVDGKAVRRNVDAGNLVGNGVEIASGLKPGDKVIVEGYQKVSEGMILKIG